VAHALVFCVADNDCDAIIQKPSGGKKKTSLEAASRDDLVVFVKKQAVKIKGLEAKVAGELQFTLSSSRSSSLRTLLHSLSSFPLHYPSWETSGGASHTITRIATKRTVG